MRDAVAFVSIAGIAVWLVLVRAGLAPAIGDANATRTAATRATATATVQARVPEDALPVEVDTGFSTAPGGAVASRAIASALRHRGVRYVWGGNTPRTGFDCSGLVRWAYAHAGVELPRTTWAMWTVGPRVPRAQLRRGDLVFAYGRGHMGIYVGAGRYVHASSSRGVTVSKLPANGRGYAGAVRITVPVDETPAFL